MKFYELAAKILDYFPKLVRETIAYKRKRELASKVLRKYKSARERNNFLEAERTEAQARYDSLEAKHKKLKDRFVERTQEARELSEERNELTYNLGIQMQAAGHLKERTKTAEEMSRTLENFCLSLYANSVRNGRRGYVLLDNRAEIAAVSPKVAKVFGHPEKDCMRVIPPDSRKALHAVSSDIKLDEIKVSFGEGAVIVDEVGVYPIAYVSDKNQKYNVGTLVEFNVKELKRLRRKSEKEGKDLLTLLKIHVIEKGVRRFLSES